MSDYLPPNTSEEGVSIRASRRMIVATVDNAEWIGARRDALLQALGEADGKRGIGIAAAMP